MTSCPRRVVPISILAGVALASAGCAEPRKPASAPVQAEAPAVRPAEPPAAPPEPAPPPPAAPEPPRDLASATPDNPLRPSATTGPAVRDDIGQRTNHGLPRLDAFKLPPGFSIELYSADVPNARSLALGGPGIVYVSTRVDNRVYAVVDKNRDHKPKKVYTVAQGLDVPNGIAYHDGNLYIAQIGRLLRLDAIDSHLASPPKPVVLNDAFPRLEHHGCGHLAQHGPDHVQPSDYLLSVHAT